MQVNLMCGVNRVRLDLGRTLTIRMTRSAMHAALGPTLDVENHSTRVSRALQSAQTRYMME